MWQVFTRIYNDIYMKGHKQLAPHNYKNSEGKIPAVALGQ